MSEPMLVLDLARGRRVQVTRKEVTSWASLDAILARLSVPKPFKVDYEDADGDRIVCGETDAELEAAFASAESAPFQEVVLRVRGQGEDTDSAVGDDEYEVLSVRDGAYSSEERSQPDEATTAREGSSSPFVVSPMFVPDDAAAGQSVEPVGEEDDDDNLPQEQRVPPPAFVGETPTEVVSPLASSSDSKAATTSEQVVIVNNKDPVAEAIAADAPVATLVPPCEVSEAPESGLDQAVASSPGTSRAAISAASCKDLRSALATLLQEPECYDAVLKQLNSPEAREAILDAAREESREAGAGWRALRERHASTMFVLSTNAVRECPQLGALLKFLLPSMVPSLNHSAAATPAVERVAHPRHQCDSCCDDAVAKANSIAAGTYNTSTECILGTRFKSAVLPDFDLCETCEAANVNGVASRGAPFLKINTPAEDPGAILCVLRSNENVPRSEMSRSALEKEFFSFIKERKQGKRNSSTNIVQDQETTPAVEAISTTPFDAPAPSVPVVSPVVSAPRLPAPVLEAQRPRPPPPPPRVTTATGCPGRHLLQRFITPHGGFVCNVCNKRQPNVTAMFGCRTCDYDECSPCHGNTSSASPPPTITLTSPSSWTVSTSSSAATSAAPYTTTYATPLPQAKFIADVTLPDGTFLEPGKRVVKIWRVKNSSATEAWPTGTKMVHVGGDLLGGPVQGVSLPSVAPGNTIDVEIPLIMPQTPGRYTTYWRLACGAPTHARFGHRFWAQLNVAAPQPVAAAASSPASVEEAPRFYTTPPTSSDLSHEMQVAVQQCLEFGFTDIDRVVAFLNETNGDVARAIDKLLASSN